jgi:GNAT superfamily N-acetyltransferase
VIVRPARPTDAAAIARVAAALGYPPAGEAPLAAVLASGDHHVLVAEAEGAVVGWAHVFVARRVASAAFAELGGLAVEPAARRQGAGRALVAAAGAWARQRGVARLRVRVDGRREEAHAFYEALGASRVKAQSVFEISLDEHGEAARGLLDRDRS